MNYCGQSCENCQFRAPCACSGCGTPFFGHCEVAKCAAEKAIFHCGQCPQFPCQKLKDCAFDTLTGDGGKRMETCRNAAQK